MYIQQLYTNCLAEAAYYIESEGEAVVIDPIREITPYLELARERNSKIKYVFETHFHADFVSGHIDLARESGAQIVYGPMAETKYPVYNAKDEEEFHVGKLTIRVLHTPGHTLESSCFLLFDENAKAYCIFTGDTLFVGDVGRPDLLDGVMSKEELAASMFESLKSKIMVLPDDVIVYPAHGPGSACGKNIGKETWSTIGQQKKTNYALLETDKDRFIQALTTGLLAPPRYFFEDAKINKSGYDDIDIVVKRNMKALPASVVKQHLINGAILLDTRTADEFEKGSVPGSLNIGLNGSFAGWVGTIIHIDKPLVLVTSSGKEQESILRLARVGFEKVLGYLDGGLNTWQKEGNPVQQVASVNPENLVQIFQQKDIVILDVRKESEFADGHIRNSVNIPLADLSSGIETLDPDKKYYVHCAGGYRSMVAASMMQAKGFSRVTNVHGGYAQIKETEIPLEIPQPA